VSIKDFKESIHETLSVGVQDLPLQEGALVVQFAVVMTCAMPDGSRSIFRFDGDAGGRDLQPWETAGLLYTALQDNNPRSTRPPDDHD
jgi:hypothetical protein